MGLQRQVWTKAKAKARARADRPAASATATDAPAEAAPSNPTGSGTRRPRLPDPEDPAELAKLQLKRVKSNACHKARNQAVKDGLDKEEAKRLGREARESNSAK